VPFRADPVKILKYLYLTEIRSEIRLPPPATPSDPCLNTFLPHFLQKSKFLAIAILGYYSFRAPLDKLAMLGALFSVSDKKEIFT
jgi:hypothetical protein